MKQLKERPSDLKSLNSDRRSDGEKPSKKGAKYKKKADAPIAQDVIDQWKKESEEMWLTNMMVNRPCCTLCVGYLILIILTYISITNDYFTISDQSARDYWIWTDPMTVDLDMFNVGSDFFETASGRQNKAVEGVRSKRLQSLFLLYTNQDDPKGLLRKSTLLNIQKLENKIQAHPEFKDYCRAQDENNKTCSNVTVSSPLNVLREMNVTKDLEDMGQLEIDELFRTAFETIEVMPKVMSFFDENVTADNMTTTYMRTIIELGSPLDVEGIRFANRSDRKDDQWDLAANFSIKIREMIEQEFSDPEEFGCRVNFATILLSLDIFLQMILNDVLFALVAVAFVFVYFIIHMRSKFLSSIGTSIILFSFPITVCITEGVGGVTYVGALQVIAIYMVLGIAADDIFVFIDAWKRSAFLSDEVFQGQKTKRMAYAFRSSARAMAITSSTTSVAFFANIFSPLLPIKTFGIFSGVIIPVNFILVVLFMPPAVIIYEERIADKFCCCFKCECIKKKVKKSASSEDEENERASSEESKEETKLGVVEQFFDGTLNKFVYKFRKQLVFFSVFWYFYVITQAAKLGPQTELEDAIDPDHPAVIVYSRMSTEFPAPTNRRPTANIYWGVKDIDRTGDSQWDPEFVGEPIFDPTFDITTKESQLYFIELCEQLEKQDFITYDSVTCWMKKFEEYVEDELDAKFPIKSKSLFMKYLNEWIDDEDNPRGASYQNGRYFGIKDNEIIFSKITARTTFGRRETGENKAIEYEKWSKFVEDQKGKAPSEMRNSMRQTCSEWPTIATEDAFVENAINGVGMAICFAFLILLYATANIIQSLLSIWCVTVVIFSIMAIMHMQGLKLGTAESISLVVLIGFSVDYIVHLSADYMHSAQHRRYDKMRQAYREMGVSILSGCLTTFGCGFCLFFGNFKFFQVFGLIITCTVVISFIVAMITFGALCHLVGPEKDTGMLCKKEVDPNKVQREEVEMELVTMLEKSDEAVQTVDGKLTDLFDKSESRVQKMQAKFEKIKDQMKQDQDEVKSILNEIIAVTK